MAEEDARSVAQSFIDGMDHDDGEVTRSRQRQVNGHDAWVTLGHSGVLAVATISWYCDQDQRTIHVLVATSAGADQVNTLADRIADSVHCHVADNAPTPQQ